MSRNNRHGGRQKSYGGTAGGGGSTGKQGKILYNAGEEPAFIRQFKARTGYQAPTTTEDKRQEIITEINERAGDDRKDDEKPQIVQLNANDLSKEEVELELAKVKEAEGEKKCIDSTGRLLFRKPKEKSDESQSSASKSEIVDMASNKSTKRKSSETNATKDSSQDKSNEKKKTKTQLLSFMDESGFDGDD